MKVILVIDDDPCFRSTMGRILHAAGYQPLEADSGSRGIDLCRSAQPDLVLSDINMSGGDGFSVLHALQSAPETADIPCILMTGAKDQHDLRTGMNSGADDYLYKPFTGEALITAVEARLKKQESVRRKAESALSELSANIATSLPHELQTPLSGILGIANIILADSDDVPPRIIELVAYIATAGKRLEHLIENFLIYAQIELLAANPTSVTEAKQKRTLNPGVLVRSLAQTVAEASKRPDDLILEVPEGVDQSILAISSDLFAKMAKELLDNAFQFSKGRSPVRVTAETDRGFFILQVQDQGRGMQPQDIRSIGPFMQFQRKFYEQQGTGLGLFIVRRLAQIHGGDLNVQSVLGSGTTASVQMPLAS